MLPLAPFGPESVIHPDHNRPRPPERLAVDQSSLLSPRFDLCFDCSMSPIPIPGSVPMPDDSSRPSSEFLHSVHRPRCRECVRFHQIWEQNLLPVLQHLHLLAHVELFDSWSLRICSRSPFTPVFSFGNRVESFRSPGMARSDPPDRKPASFQDSPLSYRFNRVVGTGGGVSTMGSQPGGDSPLIDANQSDYQ